MKPRTGDGASLLAERAKVCRPTQTNAHLPPLLEAQNLRPAGKTVRFEEIAALLSAGCASCHGAPQASAGGFSFVAQRDDKSFLVRGESKSFPGIASAAERIRASLLHADPAKRMPYGNAREGNEEVFLALGRSVSAWIDAGSPEGAFLVPDTDATGEPLAPQAPISEETDLGDCIPAVSEAGVDPQLDAFFADAKALPEKLSDTDLFSIDSLALARRGTFSYNVEYPLWADNAEKGRYVHLPARKDAAGKWERVPAVYDATKKRLVLPDNTRFYKTFYKAVKRADGTEVFRKIETRLIVVRKGNTPLMGTYVWNETASEAILNTTPYRDGTGFKDKVFLYEADAASHAARKYALPGSQRCIECHKGREDFILGFSPLQLNRRELGEAGRESPVAADERAQIDRLVAYGALAGMPAPAELPHLETAKSTEAPESNVHALRLQGYAVGNCAHCHNPDGFAMKDNKVKLDLSEGGLFNFNARAMRSIHFDFSSNKVFVNTKAFESGEVSKEALRQSYLYLRVSASPKDRDLLPFNAMPMHTPGGSNCRLVNLTAKWILSQVDAAKADAYEEKCEPHQDFSWIELDSTEPPVWQPRRADWNSPAGMPEAFRTLRYDDGMRAIASREYPVDFYQTKPTCQFPEVEAPTRYPPAWDAGVQEWMFKRDPNDPDPLAKPDPAFGPVKPLGQLYFTKPGAYLYSSMCAKCHGTRGDGQGPFATSLTVMSEGEIRVANFMSGLFKPDGSSLAQFSALAARSETSAGDGGNLAGNYLIWMAMGGTKVNFPPEVSHLTGKHKALMLNLVRDECAGFLPNFDKPVTKRFYKYGLLRDICFHDNGEVGNLPADLGFLPETIPPLPVDAVKQDAWLDKAAFNAGWAIYHYLKEDASKGRWQPAINECEVRYGVPQPPAP